MALGPGIRAGTTESAVGCLVCYFGWDAGIHCAREGALSARDSMTDTTLLDPKNDIEMQIRRYNAWSARSAYYLARTLTEQLKSGDDYRCLKSVIGVWCVIPAGCANPVS